MFFGGSTQGMITSLKNNARPKRSFKERFGHEHAKFKQAFTDKEITQEEQTILKNKIKERIKKEQKSKTVKALFFSGIIAFFIFISIALLSHKSNINFSSANDVMKVKQLKKENERNLKINTFLAKGNKAIKKNNYPNAKYYFNKALFVDNNNNEVLIANAKIFILDCNDNNIECGVCNYHYKNALEKVGLERLKKELGNQLKIYRVKLNNEIVEIIKLGDKELEKSFFYDAHSLYYEAYSLDPENYNANISLLKLKIIEFKSVQSNGNYTEIRLMEMERKFGKTKELKELRIMYDNKN